MIDFTLPYVKIITDSNLAIAVQQGNDALRNQFNDALRKLRDDGTLQTIIAAIAADLPGWQARLPDWAYCWTRINNDPTGYDSVQAAVDAASEGDTVKVAGYCTGVHVRSRNDITTTGVVTQVVYVSKTVTIQGGYTTTNWTTPDSDANPTTLDAQGQGRVLYITGDISPTVEGLRITGGDAAGLGGDLLVSTVDVGGGVYGITATVSLNHCQVNGNAAQGGGGIYLHGDGTALSSNAIFSNTAQQFGGGGYVLWSKNVTVNNNAIYSNVAGSGGGIYLWYCNATVNGNVIRGNEAQDGGGVYLWNGHSDNTLLRNNLIFDNTASRWGGGINMWDSTHVTLDGNEISGNMAQENGGGIWLNFSTAKLENNTIYDNEAVAGGGIYMRVSDSTLINNLVADNQVAAWGSGLYIAGSNPHLLHTTIARNTGGDGSSVYATTYSGAPSRHSTVALTNTIFVSHTVGISVTGGNTVTVNGILWHNTPVTTSQSPTATVSVQNEHTGAPAFAADGYHITPASAAMDAGVDAGVTTDIDGHVRPYNAIPDLGADEIIATFVPTDTESTLVYTDTQGLATTVQVPADAVTEAVTLAYTPVETATSPFGFAFAGRAFDLDAYQGGTLLPGFTFSTPVTITLHYDEADIGGVEEDTLVLHYWSGDEWIDAACGDYDRHPADDWLAVPICHLSRFALFGEQRKVYLPLVLRDY
jgi:parallel beta-helix repeat protein